MSRTNDVNIAMQYAKSGVDGVHLMDSHKATIGWVVNTLAAEVERLEAELSQANVAAKAGMYAHDERTFLAECAEKQEQRAEAAEARVKELKLKLMRQDEAAREAYEAAVWKYGQERMELEARVRELEAENARLLNAIRDCVDWSNGREYEWGDRAENAFGFLHRALADTKGAMQHPDDTAVDKFAAAMKAKLERKREQGYHGWDDKDDCSQQHLVGLLVAHMAKGDPVDVGNFAMMLWNRGERTALAETKGGAA